MLDTLGHVGFFIRVIIVHGRQTHFNPTSQFGDTYHSSTNDEKVCRYDYHLYIVKTRAL